MQTGSLIPETSDIAGIALRLEYRTIMKKIVGWSPRYERYFPPQF